MTNSRDAEDGNLNGFALSEDLIQSPSHQTASTGTINDFDGLLQPSLKLHQDLSNGNGGKTWEAGMVLAKYILRTKREDVKNRSIVELGAGGGLVGLAVAVGCSPNKSIQITDQEPMLALMRRNIALNKLEDQVAAHVYDWGEPRPETVYDHPNIVLAADCVYFEPAFPLLQQTLQDLIGASTICYFCFKKRRRADLHFMKTVRKQFLVEPVEDDPDSDVYSRQNIFLYRIRRKEG